jgi:hypothetical protein
MGARADDAGLPGTELRERRRDGQVITLPGVPGYLVKASGGIVESPAEQQPNAFRRKWERLPALTRRNIVVLMWILLLVAVIVIIAVAGAGGTESGGGGG